MLRAATVSTQDSKEGLSPLLEHKATTPQEGVIRIPLPKEFSALAVSGDTQFFNSFMDIITPLDRNLTTFARLPGAFETVYTGEFTVGAVNKGLSENQNAAIAYYVLLAVHALYCNYLSGVAQKKKDQETQNIYKLFEQKKAEEVKAALPGGMNLISDEDEAYRKKILEDAMEFSFTKEVESLNNFLTKVRENDKALIDKYDAIYIDPEKRELCFKRKPEADQGKQDGILKSIWKHGIKPLYNSGTVAAVAFWLLWISAAATTGMQDLGITGVSTWIGVGVPAGLGLINLGSYYYNAIKYGGFEKARQKAEADADFQVVTKALLLREHERDMEYLNDKENQLLRELEKRGISGESLPRPKYFKSGIHMPDGLGDQPLVKGTFTLVSNSAGYWSGSQSLGWYGKVLLETAFTASLVAPFIGETIGVVGGVMLGLACVFGIANGYQRYKEAKALKDEKDTAEKSDKLVLTLDQFEVIYKQRVAYLEKLKSDMQVYKKAHEREIGTAYYIATPRVFDVVKLEEKPTSFLGKCKAKIIDASMVIRNHPIIDAWDTSLSGIVIGRVLFATAAIFLPFAPVLLTGPAGVAAILAVGLVYLGMKWYENYQKKKEERIRQMPDKLEELEKTIQKAELVKHDMELSDRLTKGDRRHTQVVERGVLNYQPDPMHKKLFSKSVASESRLDSKQTDYIELDVLNNPATTSCSIS